MLMDQEQFEREQRAKRLVKARKDANFTSARAACERFGWKHDAYKAHESGRNGFGVAVSKAYAKAFKVSLNWLQFGTGDQTDSDDIPPTITDVPMVSWISAGQFGEQEAVEDLSDFPTITAIDLPDGDWIALRVDGPSMNKISPPESIIFANRRDKRLVSNGCYVIADESGAATYKRYRPNDDPPFQPASYDDIEPPELEGVIKIIGRVRRSVIDM